MSDADAERLYILISFRRAGRCADGEVRPRRYRRRSEAALTASKQRRRLLGGSGALPPGLRPFFTEAQRSVACVVSGEVRKHGTCVLSIGEMGARAGVGPTLSVIRVFGTDGGVI